MSSYSQTYLGQARQVLDQLDCDAVEKVVREVVSVRARDGRLFILGVGGGAGHASHAVNDFRKIAGIEAYTPTDNVSELTARVNDDGWDTSFVNWLKVSRLNDRDLILVFSVGGGDLEKNVSPNLVRALQHAKTIGTAICGIVGRKDGETRPVRQVRRWCSYPRK